MNVVIEKGMSDVRRKKVQRRAKKRRKRRGER